MQTQCEVRRQRAGPEDQLRELEILIGSGGATQAQELRAKQLREQTTVVLPPRGARTEFFAKYHRRH